MVEKPRTGQFAVIRFEVGRSADCEGGGWRKKMAGWASMFDRPGLASQLERQNMAWAPRAWFLGVVIVKNDMQRRGIEQWQDCAEGSGEKFRSLGQASETGTWRIHRAGTWSSPVRRIQRRTSTSPMYPRISSLAKQLIDRCCIWRYSSRAGTKAIMK
jgi:hypothetical protein